MKKLIVFNLISFFFIPINLSMLYNDDVNIRLNIDHVSYKVDGKWTSWEPLTAYVVIRSVGNEANITIYANKVMRYVVHNSSIYMDEDDDTVYEYEALCNETNKDFLFRVILFNDSNIVHFYIDFEGISIVYNVHSSS